MFGTPGFNPAAPGTIGATTPFPIFGTTLSGVAAATGYNSSPQLSFDYSSTRRGRQFTDSDGGVHVDAPDGNNGPSILFYWDFQGVNQITFGSGVFALIGSTKCLAVNSQGTYTAGRPKVAVGYYGNSAEPGLSDGGAANTLGLTVVGVEQVIITSGLVAVRSGGVFQLGNSATTGLTAGVLAALTNASVTIKDAAGQTYRVPCII